MTANNDAQVIAQVPLSQAHGTAKVGEMAQGWQLLIGCTLGIAVGVHSLPFYTTGLFMASLTRDFGWTRTQISVGPTVLVGILAITAPFVGAAVDRFGARRVGIPSLACVVAGFVALSFSSGSLTAFYATFALMALAATGSTTPTWTRLINQAFRQRRGTALGIGLVGSGLVSSLSPILLTSVITSDGWQAAYRWLAAVVATAMLLIFFFTRKPPTPEASIVEASGAIVAEQQGVSMAVALRDPVFWTLFATFVCIAVASSGLIVHFVPLLLDDGVTPAGAAAFASVIGISIIVARLATGALMDVFFAPFVAAALMTASACGFAALAFGGPSYAVAGAIAIGLSFGAEFDFVSYLCARYFGLRAYGRLYGLMYAAVLGGTSSSPLIYGLVRQSYGSYTVMLYIAAAVLLLSACVFLSLRRFELSSPAA